MIDWVIFDWGNTVMRDLPQFSGPMAGWPQVEALPDIETALIDLHATYQIALATNAAESGAELARVALTRVGLADYFARILTARELGASKPDPAFFEHVLATCGCLPHRAVMVGDSFRTDIVGAKHAGLWAVWYNPAGTPLPLTIPIAPDAEIATLADLPAAIRALDEHAAGHI